MTASTFETGFRRIALAAGLVAAAFVVAPAFAQDATPKPAAPAAKPAAPAAKPAAKPAAPAKAAPAPAAQAPEDPYPWVKICQKDAEQKSVCLIAKELRGANGELIASVALRDTEGEPKKTLLVAIPPAVLIQPGLRIMVDKSKPEEVKFRICFPNACYADLELSDQTFNELKKASVLVVTALNLQQKPSGYPFRLDTFKAALDGPAVDPTGGRQNQDQLQIELQKRAEEAAKKLQGGEAPKP